MQELIDEIRQCQLCAGVLPLGVRPVIQADTSSRIVIIGQAPGKRVHESGIPWNDASGKTLRKWLNVSDDVFYDPALFSIVPMGFCYPGKGVSGDLPPRPECAPMWHARVFQKFTSKPLFILIGQYAQRYYLGKKYNGNLTETVKKAVDFLPDYMPLPHPSPRNQNWLKVNPWFEEQVLPVLRSQVCQRLSTNS
jgi:uracil-DNA glycosylase